MFTTFIKLGYRIKFKLNKLYFLSNKNIKVGIKFRLGDNTTSMIHKTAQVEFGNYIDIRNGFNLVVGKNAIVKLADNVIFNNNCSINCLENIFIDENTLIGEDVKFYDHNHKYNSKEISHKEFTTSPIHIGKNCWLGSNVIILKGVTIGDNSIIGAGCIIHKDVPKNSIIVNKQEHKIIPH